MIDEDENKTNNIIIARYYITMCLDHNQTTHSALESCDIVTTTDTWLSLDCTTQATPPTLLVALSGVD